jgi:hypothetical protein
MAGGRWQASASGWFPGCFLRDCRPSQHKTMWRQHPVLTVYSLLPLQTVSLFGGRQTGGVQLVDTAEAGKLLTGSTAAAAPGRPAAGSKLLASQRPRLPSPPPLGSTAGAAPSAAAAAAAASPRVAVELQVTPEQTVAVTLRVIQPPAGRLPGLRQRAGFGSSLGGRQMGGAAAAAGGAPGAVQAAVTGAAWGSAAAAAGAEAAAAAAAAEKKPRKPKKRVSWKSERELESVRWFVKEDPAIKVSVGAAEAGAGVGTLCLLVFGRHPLPAAGSGVNWGVPAPMLSLVGSPYVLHSTPCVCLLLLPPWCGTGA